MGFFQGLLGNMSEVSVEKLQQEYGQYLMESETISTGFILIRDVVLFTDKRVLYFDKQGATGQKMRVSSIYLDSIICVSAETSGNRSASVASGRPSICHRAFIAVSRLAASSGPKYPFP